MGKEELEKERQRLSGKIGKLNSEKRKLDKELKKIEKEQKEKEEKRLEKFREKIEKIFDKKVLKKVEKVGYYNRDRFWNDEGDDQEMIIDLTKEGYIDYDWESIIDKNIKSANEILKESKARYEGLIEFKKEIKKEYEKSE